MTAASLWRNPVAIGIAALLLVILAAATFAIVPETEQAVIIRLERPIAVVNPYRSTETFGGTGAGLIARLPFFDRLVWVDKRVLDVDAENQQVLSSDQQRLEVDAYARFRVVDPMRMVNTARSEQGVTQALTPLLASAIRSQIGKIRFQVLLSPDRDKVMAAITARLQRTASQYGVQIVDVRIKHADLPSGSPLDRTLERMRTARQQQAAFTRAQGNKDAQIIQANADAQAAQIYAQAFNKDASFYDFYRSMQSYRQTFIPGRGGAGPKGSTNWVLSPNNGYLRNFENGGR
ncbi:MAG: protease modulator HflC [Janthinobacterium lividum]